MSKKIIYSSLAAVAVVGLVGASLAFLFNSKQETPVEKKKTASLVFSEEPETLDEAGFDGAFSMLVVGSDSREGQRYQDGVEGELNDVTLLLKVDESHQRADIISFPRDTIVPMGSCSGSDPDSDYRQLNTGLTVGGVDCVRAVVEHLTGETVSGTVLVSFNAVEDLTEAVGGVPVCVAEPIYNHDSGDLMFDSGRHNLTGSEALAFVRERHGFGNGSDLGRIYNQQVFLKSFMKEFRASSIMSSPVKFWKLADASLNNLKLSSNLTNPLELLKLANTFLDVPSDNFQFYTAPVQPNPSDPNRLLIDEELLAELLTYVNTPPLTVEKPADETDAVSSDTETSNTEEIVVPDKPETIPGGDVYAPKTGDEATVTVCE